MNRTEELKSEIEDLKTMLADKEKELAEEEAKPKFDFPCTMTQGDGLDVSQLCGHIFVKVTCGENMSDVRLDPDDARKLARRLNQLAKEAAL